MRIVLKSYQSPLCSTGVLGYGARIPVARSSLLTFGINDTQTWRPYENIYHDSMKSGHAIDKSC